MSDAVRFRSSTFLPLILLCIVALLAFAACGDDDDDDVGSAGDGAIVITEAWARPAALLGGDDEMDHDDMEATAGEDEMDATAAEGGMDMGGTNGAVYMTIENQGDEADRLLAAETEIAEAVELHNVNMVEGVMQMRPVDGGIEIPAGDSATVVLEPGGLHVMLIGLSQSLEIGDSFDVELEFENAGSITVDVEVREP